MIEKRCKTCIWWDSEHPRLQYAPEVSGIANPGFCRKHKPGAYTMHNERKEAYAIGIQPITDADEGCAEHRETG
jgi:hypothetical protein